jgi:hypothetical protein
MSLSDALASAVATARAALGDPVGRVWVVTPSSVASELARRELGTAHDVLDVRFQTPGRLVGELAEVELAIQGLQPLPAGWHRARVEALLDEGTVGGRFSETLQARGWASALARLVRELQGAGIAGAALRDLPLTPDLRERCALVADLLDALDSSLAREGRASPTQAAAAAIEALASGHPAADPGAVVLLGDGRLPPLERHVLARWLRGRPVVRVGLSAFEALEPEPGGLRALAPDAAGLAVSGGASSIELVSTPDEVREASELVRTVQAALATDPSLALDRVAIVLPDTEIVEPLAAALQRAGIPATWLIGRPLAETQAGRFVGALLALHDEAPVVQWYSLLTEPGLRLGARLGTQALQGRGRWRRFLAPLRHARSVLAVLGALDRRIEEALTAGPGEEEDRIALQGLRACLVAVRGLVSELRRARSPSQLAAALLPLLHPVQGWWRRGADTSRLASTLEGLARDGVGDVLAETPLLAGSLTDPALRVLEPMSTLGGTFDLVLVAGLVNKTFPREPSEDPILPDTARRALTEATGILLATSEDQPALERRRLAAVLSSARGRLVGFVARSDFSKGRPALLSPFARELASLAAGTPQTFSDAERALIPRGSRSGVPPEPEAALGAGQHLAARLAQGSGLDAALAHPAAGPAMHRARALARLAAGEVSAELLPYAGVVPAELGIPEGGWEAPMEPRRLWSMLEDPEDWLLGQLGARSLSTLRPGFDPTTQRAVRRRLLRVLADLLREGRTTRAEVLTAAATTLSDELAEYGFERPDALVAELVREADGLLGDPADLPSGGGLGEPRPVDPGAPFVIEGGDGLPGAQDLVALVETKPTRNNKATATQGVGLEALALGSGLVARTIDDVEVPIRADELAPVRERVQATAAAVTAGWFPSIDTGSGGQRPRPPRHRLSDDVPWDWADPDVAIPILAQVGGER